MGSTFEQDIATGTATARWSTGYKWFTPWSAYLITTRTQSGVTNVLGFNNGQGGFLNLTNNGSSLSYRSQITCNMSNATPILFYPDGTKEIYSTTNVDQNGAT